MVLAAIAPDRPAGIAFGYARYKTASTASAALLHAGYNLTFFVGYLIQQRP
jgi:hypothetical protein